MSLIGDTGNTTIIPVIIKRGERCLENVRLMTPAREDPWDCIEAFDRTHGTHLCALFTERGIYDEDGVWLQIDAGSMTDSDDPYVEDAVDVQWLLERMDELEIEDAASCNLGSVVDGESVRIDIERTIPALEVWWERDGEERCLHVCADGDDHLAEMIRRVRHGDSMDGWSDGLGRDVCWANATPMHWNEWDCQWVEASTSDRAWQIARAAADESEPCGNERGDIVTYDITYTMGSGRRINVRYEFRRDEDDGDDEYWANHAVEIEEVEE